MDWLGRKIGEIREPEWDDDERAWMLALQMYRSRLCPCGCGRPAAESQAPETLAEATGQAVRYEVDVVKCFAREAINKAQEQMDTRYPGAHLFAVRHVGN